MGRHKSKKQPLTVQGLIERLQQMLKDGTIKRNQVVFADGGDGTVLTADEIWTGFAYQYTKKKTYGGTNMLFVREDDGSMDFGEKRWGIWITGGFGD